VKRMMRVLFVLGLMTSTAWADATIPGRTSGATEECLDCHRDDNPGLYKQWGASKHFGANVGCYECHAAKKGDVDVLRDDIHDDFIISTIVSPKDCARCHDKEVEEFVNSHHAKAGRIMGSLDNLLAEVVEGNNGFVTPAFPNGVSALPSTAAGSAMGQSSRFLQRPASWILPPGQTPVSAV